MTDLEITKLCAEAMGLRVETAYWSGPRKQVWVLPELYDENIHSHPPYDPLHDDAQAMALVKKFILILKNTTRGWHVENVNDGIGDGVRSDDLNRAICESVAKMQKAKVPA